MRSNGNLQSESCGRILFTVQVCIGKFINCSLTSPVAWIDQVGPRWKPHCQTHLVWSHSFYILPVKPQMPSFQPGDQDRIPVGPKWATFDRPSAAGPTQQERHIPSESHCGFHVYPLCSLQAVLPSHPSWWCAPELGREARLFVSVCVLHIVSHAPA